MLFPRKLLPVLHTAASSFASWLVALFVVIILLTTYYTVQQNTKYQLEQETQNRMDQLIARLNITLAQHAYLPGLLAENPLAQSLLQATEIDPEQQAQLNAKLAKANRIADTAEIYLMREDGLTIATSNAKDDLSFLNKNFDFRPYFKQAIQGRLGRYYALGTTSGERGYYFAAGVRNTKGKLNGVMVVKVDIADLEEKWSRAESEFIVADPDGVVFMSSNPEWRMHSLWPLSTQARAHLAQNRRYAKQDILPLKTVNVAPQLGFQHSAEGKKPYLVLRKRMYAAGWYVHILTDWRKVTRAALLATSLAALMLSLTLLLLYLLWKNHRQKREYEQRTLEQLEAKVDERTRELRRTQEELIQAAKMAALGQLSAGINHELNNPLSAIRAYADNAAQFIERGQLGIASNNLQEIVGLTERMAAITRQLKTFSRKSAGEIKVCDLHHAVDAALGIMQAKLNASQLELSQQREPASRYVKADQVWLEQILVNLLSNALEAVQEQEKPHIQLRLSVQQQQVWVQVQDNGVGVSEAVMPHVFEAFFTTKTIGKGLGLGLAISYRLARDMEGDLSVANAVSGGAIFTLSLPISQEEVQL